MVSIGGIAKREMFNLGTKTSDRNPDLDFLRLAEKIGKVAFLAYTLWVRTPLAGRDYIVVTTLSTE